MTHNNEDVLCVQVISRQLGFDLLFSNSSPRLLTAAEAYFHLGWSVIPLLGDIDPSRPKTPAVPWAGYQHYRASLAEQQQWFTDSGVGGLGIVTGRVSQLVVLDFDSEEVFKDFRGQYPDLTETHTVCSAGRQLPHLYFKLPDYLHFESQKGQGIDLLSNGRYVVAPPTTFNGQPYKITRGGMPRTLTERDMRRIQAFLKFHKLSQPNPVQTQSPAFISLTGSISSPQKTTRNDLERLYLHHCQKGGRNEALFRTSLYARDTGWQEKETQQCLVGLHSQQPARLQQPKEHQINRQREALNTIKSAYSRPARRNTPLRQTNIDQLPNSVREALMQRKMTYVLRTIEGLSLEGFRPAQVFSTQQAELTLKGLVGRDSVHKALQSLANPELPFFVRVSPNNPFKTAKAVDTSKKRLNNKKCFLLPRKNQEKIDKGRPQHYYQMPSVDDLCRLLGVASSNSDPLERNDLATARQTRMALHRELIKRRPGQYTRRWLANRLGVTKPTIDSYNAIIPIHSRPTYAETVIRWDSIAARLPLDEPLRGAFLVTMSGKQYPALRTIASKLLAKGEVVCLKEREGNCYWYGEHEPALPQLMAVYETFNEKQKNLDGIRATQDLPFGIPESLWNRHSPTSKQGRAVPPKTNYHKPLKDILQEALAQYVYTTINAQADKQLSLSNARRIALMQSEERVRAAVRLVQQRSRINNPAGFLLTILRSKYG